MADYEAEILNRLDQMYARFQRATEDPPQNPPLSLLPSQASLIVNGALGEWEQRDLLRLKQYYRERAGWNPARLLVEARIVLDENND